MKWLKRILIAIVGLAVVGAGVQVALLYLFPEKVARTVIAAWRKSSGLVRKEVTLKSGIHYVFLEGGQGEPLLLLHGFGANKDAFLPISGHLTPHFRVVIPDQIGFGESAHPPDADYNPAAQAERLRELAQTLGMNKPHLGGSSMGGQIAMAYAALHPDEVPSLWLMNPAGVWSAPQSELLRLIDGKQGNPLLVRNETDFEKLLSFTMTKPMKLPRPVMRVFAQERIQNFALEERIFAQILAYSVEEKIRNLQTPTLIAWGDQDRTLHNDTAEILRKLLPHSEVRLMPGIGHMPLVEAPKQTAEDYLMFRNSLKP